MDIIMLALVWGVLLVYFLTPFQRKKDSLPKDKMSFSAAVRLSIVSVTFHKKAIMAFTLILLSCIAVWWSQSQNDLYRETHALDPERQPPYLIGILLYSLLVYCLVVVRKAIKLLKFS
jgi:hypothetical protein